MRKSVLTGIFACTLFLGMGTSRASALNQDNQEKTGDQRVVAILTSTDNVTALQVIDNVTQVADEVLPIEPIVKKHIVAENETLSLIAKTYNTTWQRLFYKNTNIEDPNIISQGMELTIPEDNEQLEERAIPIPEPVVKRSANTATTQSSSSVSRPVSVAGNKYGAGYCTWYVKNRRPDLPNNLGNARTWVSRAAAQGMSTGTTPVSGAVGQRGNHVVYVESVNGDGTVTISEMNHVGWNVTSTRTVSADYFTYIY